MPFDDRSYAGGMHPIPVERSPAAIVYTAMIISRIRRWRNLSRQRRALARLDDRILKDIGIRHEDAAVEAQRHFWDDPSTSGAGDTYKFGYRFFGQLMRLRDRG